MTPGETTGAKVGQAFCPDCRRMLPVEVPGPWHGGLEEQCDAAMAAVAAGHPAHDTVPVIREDLAAPAGALDITWWDELTDEQVAEFRAAFEHADLSRIKILPPSLATPPAPRDFDYRVIITWPAPQPQAMPGCLISVHDAESGDQIYAITRLALYAEADGVVWARAEMLLGSDGKPSRPAGPLADLKTGDDGEPVTGIFSLLVAEMRIAEPEP